MKTQINTSMREREDEYMIEIDHISHSQIDLWEKCPRKWEYKYVYHLKERSSDALIIGNVYHKVLEQNFKAKMELGHDLDIDICMDVFSDTWDKVVSEEWDIRWVKNTPESAKDMCAALVEKYITEFAPPIFPQAVEQWLESSLNGTKFVLKLDLINQDGAVIDHKTAAQSYTQLEVDKDMQASATAFCLGRPIVFYNHVAVKTATPRIQCLRTFRTNEHVEWWKDKVTAIIEHMKTGYAPPREDSWLCSPMYCDNYSDCMKHITKSIFT